MAECFIFDAVRSPRGRGKKDGSLHEVTALELATQSLQAIRDRSTLDTAELDDVIMGCVDPVGEQGADIARAAVLKAGYAQNVPGVQVNRFCASGLEACNMAAGQIMAGNGLAIGGGVEAMSRVPSARPAAPGRKIRPSRLPISCRKAFPPIDRDAGRILATMSMLSPWKASSARDLDRRLFQNSVVPVKDSQA
jgi:acetyl-CoA acetyltransferase